MRKMGKIVCGHMIDHGFQYYACSRDKRNVIICCMQVLPSKTPIFVLHVVLGRQDGLPELLLTLAGVLVLTAPLPCPPEAMAVLGRSQLHAEMHCCRDALEPASI